MVEFESTLPFILIFALPGIFLISYIFTGTISPKYEDEPYVYKVWKNVLITIFLVAFLGGLSLYTFEIVEFSFKWFLIILFSIQIVIQMYLDRKHMSHTNLFITDFVSGVYILVVFFLFL